MYLRHSRIRKDGKPHTYWRLVRSVRRDGRAVQETVAQRAQAHILLCFLGYVLWKTLEQWQERAGLGKSPRTVLDELARIQSSDVVLPLADGSGRELRIRCVVRPDKAQAMLIDRLGLRLPERLRIPTRIDKM